MSAQLDQLLTARQLRECQAADAANAAALSATIAQAIRPRASLAQMAATTLASGTVEPTEVADLIEEIERRVDRRFSALDDCAENQALIEVLYEVGETLRQARLRFVALDALCEGVKL